MKVIVWSSGGKRIADYQKLMRGCEMLCLLDCGSWTIKPDARKVQPDLYRWKEQIDGLAYDVIYSMEGVAMILQEGWYDKGAVVYNIHSSIKSLIGIKLKNDCWLFTTKDSGATNACPIAEFYLKEVSERFRQAVFVSAFGKKEYAWSEEATNCICRVNPPGESCLQSFNYLFAVRVVCIDKYLVEGYEGLPNQPTLFEIDI